MKKLNDMIEFGGKVYIIDIDRLNQLVISDTDWESKKIIETEIKTVTNEDGDLMGTEKLEKFYSKAKEIDTIKYEALRMFIEVLIDYDEETDETLGSDRALSTTPLSYKLAFNTLMSVGVLKEIE